MRLNTFARVCISPTVTKIANSSLRWKWGRAERRFGTVDFRVLPAQFRAQIDQLCANTTYLRRSDSHDAVTCASALFWI